jgi:hypothetical protein
MVAAQPHIILRPEQPTPLVNSAQTQFPIPEYRESMFSFICYICREPLSLVDASTVADEHGKALHEDCYVKQLTTPQEQAS